MILNQQFLMQCRKEPFLERVRMQPLHVKVIPRFDKLIFQKSVRDARPCCWLDALLKDRLPQYQRLEVGICRQLIHALALNGSASPAIEMLR